jgi:hypothetical protein
MAFNLSFPTSPSPNQTYTFGTKTWVWNGVAWQLQTSGAINNVPIGNSIPSTGAFTNLSAANIAGNYVSVVGNIQGGNVQGGNVVLTGNTIGGPSNLTLTSSNVTFAGNVYVEGNTTFISSNSITTNSLLIQLANNATLGAAANNAGITVGANSNVFASLLYNDTTKNWISSIGLSVVGNVSANYFIGNGSQLTNINASNIVGAYGNANVAAYLPTYTGNVSSGNISATGNVSIAGNIVAGGVRSSTQSTAPTNPSVGDFWYNTLTNSQYRYTFDGTDYFWLDDFGATVAANGSFNAITSGTSNVSIYRANADVQVNVNGTGNVAVFSTSGATFIGLTVTTSNTPATSSSTGTTGQIQWDSNYVYVCIAPNTWKRANISSW